jgi:hypothetical protein
MISAPLLERGQDLQPPEMESTPFLSDGPDICSDKVHPHTTHMPGFLVSLLQFPDYLVLSTTFAFFSLFLPFFLSFFLPSLLPSFFAFLSFLIYLFLPSFLIPSFLFLFSLISFFNSFPLS